MMSKQAPTMCRNVLKILQQVGFHCQLECKTLEFQFRTFVPHHQYLEKQKKKGEAEERLYRVNGAHFFVGVFVAE